MDFVAKLVKTTTGRVLMYDAANNLLANYSTSAECRRALNRNGLRIYEQYASASIDVLVSKVVSTQIEPAAAVPFSGTIYDLWAILSNSFFNTMLPTSTTNEQANLSLVSGQTTTNALNNISGGGGETIETEIEVASGTFDAEIAYQNYVCTGNCTIVLPAVASGKYKFKVWAAQGVTVSIKGQPGENVNNKKEIQISGAAMVTLRNLLTELNWSIGE